MRSPGPSETVVVVDKLSTVVETTLVSEEELGSEESVVVSVSFPGPPSDVVVSVVAEEVSIVSDVLEVGSVEVEVPVVAGELVVSLVVVSIEEISDLLVVSEDDDGDEVLVVPTLAAAHV